MIGQLCDGFPETLLDDVYLMVRTSCYDMGKKGGNHKVDAPENLKVYNAPGNLEVDTSGNHEVDATGNHKEE